MGEVLTLLVGELLTSSGMFVGELLISMWANYSQTGVRQVGLSYLILVLWSAGARACK